MNKDAKDKFIVDCLSSEFKYNKNKKVVVKFLCGACDCPNEAKVSENNIDFACTYLTCKHCHAINRVIDE